MTLSYLDDKCSAIARPYNHVSVWYRITRLDAKVGYRTTYEHCNKKLTIPDDAPVINTTLFANASLGGVERIADAKLVLFLSATKSLPIAMHENRLVKPPIAAKTAVVCCDRRNAGRAIGRKSRRLRRRDSDE